MEEIVALDSKKQKNFVKSIKGIKKLIKKNKGKSEVQKKDEKVEPQIPFSMRLEGGTVQQQHKKRKERGLVYLAHIPHGFYEHQMTQYFKQFGVVTNARVIKSKRTGNSKGFAFVEFKEPAVGQIVAETMNNYLMGKRLIKAVYIPPEKQKLKAFRKHWNAINNPSSQARLKIKKAINADKDEKAELQKAKKLLSNLTKTKKRLSELGINYDFFTPVDVPEALQNKLVKEEKDVKETKPSKTIAGKKGKAEQGEDKNVKAKNEPAKPDSKNALVLFKKDKQQTKKPKEKMARRKSVSGNNIVEEFIKIAESDYESDVSYVFDPEEYKRQEEAEDKYITQMLSGRTDDTTSNDSSESVEEKLPVRRIIKRKVQKKAIALADKPKEQPQKVQVQKPQKKNQPQNKAQEVKRKAAQKPAVTGKKPKFEKQNQKQTQKSFKKK